jgi:histidyl-tRNA synthetase
MIQTPPYTRDLLPAEFSADVSRHIHRFQHIEAVARDLFRRYGFKEIRTPIFEHTELFARGVGAETDIVTKEMFTWTDRGDEDEEGRSLTLRPENTAPVMRAYIQHQMWKLTDLAKLFYAGPQFRRERGQKGRFRQFYQIGAEVLGASDNPAIEAEVIEMLTELLATLGIENTELRINSVGDAECRPRFTEMIRRELASHLSRMSETSRRRYETNPLRLLDSKEDQEIIAQLPSTLDLLNDECRAHFDALRRHLDARNIAYVIDHRLVRGLDYYTKTVFEIVSFSDDIGAQNALLGGGRYDKLSETLDGPPTKGLGFALGLDRFVMALPTAAVEPERPDLFIAHLGDAALEKALLLVREARRAGLSGWVDFERRSLKSAMRLANKLNARLTLILGDAELESGQWPLRSMADSGQTVIAAERWLHEVTAALAADRLRAS